MGTRAAPVRKSKRSLGDYTRALGSAHKKASVHLETSMPLVAFIIGKIEFHHSPEASGWLALRRGRFRHNSGGVTPTIDPVNMGLVMLPLIGLCIISIILAAIAGRR